jgi:hypothetical protein
MVLYAYLLTKAECRPQSTPLMSKGLRFLRQQEATRLASILKLLQSNCNEMTDYMRNGALQNPSNDIIVFT